TPPWQTKAMVLEIRMLYEKAAELSKTSGTEHNVDHVIPLQGANVSGLHVPWNLQIITAAANSKKNNKVPVITHSPIASLLAFMLTVHSDFCQTVLPSGELLQCYSPSVKI